MGFKFILSSIYGVSFHCGLYKTIEPIKISKSTCSSSTLLRFWNIYQTLTKGGRYQDMKRSFIFHLKWNSIFILIWSSMGDITFNFSSKTIFHLKEVLQLYIMFYKSWVCRIWQLSAISQWKWSIQDSMINWSFILPLGMGLSWWNLYYVDFLTRTSTISAKSWKSVLDSLPLVYMF